MRSSRLVPLVLLLVAIIGLIAGVLVVVKPSRVISGAAVVGPAPPVRPGKNALLDPLPVLPTAQWRVDARQLFGPQDSSRFVIVVAAARDIGIAKSLSAQYGPGPIAAFSPEDGRQLWSAPSDFVAKACAFSRDGRLACIHDETRTVGFLDPKSGRVLTTRRITASGYVDLSSAGDGFLVESSSYPEHGDKKVTLTWLSSDGSRQWSNALPPKIDNVQLSVAGNVVTAADYQTGVQVFELDTGRLLYDASDDLRSAGPPGSSTISVVPTAAGFAVSIQLDATHGGGRHLTVYDPSGVRRNAVDGWKLWLLPKGTEGDLIVVMSEQDHQSTVGVLNAATNQILWQQDCGWSDDAELVGDEHVAVRASGAGSGDAEYYGYTLYEASSGNLYGKFNASLYQTIRGFDGQRLIFEGDDNGDDPGPDGFTAVDAATGARTWRIKNSDQTPGEDAFPVNFNTAGPFFFRYDARIGDSVAAITRLASS